MRYFTTNQVMLFREGISGTLLIIVGPTVIKETHCILGVSLRDEFVYSVPEQETSSEVLDFNNVSCPVSTISQSTLSSHLLNSNV